MGCKMRMTTCSDKHLLLAESSLQARGLRLVEYSDDKQLLPDKEYMKRPLEVFDTGIPGEKHWALIWCNDEEQ